MKNLRLISQDGDLSREALFGYLILFGLVTAGLMVRNSGWSDADWETKYFFRLWDYVERVSAFLTLNQYDPLQGMFGALPAAKAPAIVPGFADLASLGAGASPTFYWVGSSLLMLVSVFVFARVIGFDRTTALVGGLIWPIVLVPWALTTPWIGNFHILIPAGYALVPASVMVAAMYWHMGRGRLRNSVLLSLLIGAVLLLIGFSQAVFLSLVLPVILVMGFAAICASRSRAELKAKIISAIMIAALLFASGVPAYLNVVNAYTAFAVFNSELQDAISLGSASFANQFLPMFVHILDLGTGFSTLWLVLTAWAGALFFDLGGQNRDIRVAARALIIGVVVFGISYHFVYFAWFYFEAVYMGPAFEQYRFLFWPYYSLFAAAIVIFLIRRLIALASRVRPSHSRYRLTIPSMVPACVLLVFLVSVGLAQTHYDHAVSRQSVRTPVTEFLRTETEFAYGEPFRGRVVTFPERVIERASGATKGRFAAAQARAFEVSGNDMASLGLWDFNIPTLFSWNRAISPEFFLLTAEMLSRPGIDRHTRGFSMITIPNEKLLALFGVRYVVVDSASELGQVRFRWKLPEAYGPRLQAGGSFRNEIFVRELANPNLGQYSPSKVIAASSAHEVVVTMKRPDFDGARMVVVTDSLSGEFVSAENVVMQVVPGGLKVQADSAGDSLLVLPAEFSNCWHIANRKGASLFRANLGMLGVKFRGRADFVLERRSGPLFNHSCIKDDLRDTARLEMQDARTASIEDPYYVPFLPAALRFDQENLIELEDAVLTKVNVELNETGRDEDWGTIFRLTATGDESVQHYFNTGFVKVAPGVHTLSLWVAEDSVENLRMQLLDDAGRGLIADYSLSEGSTSVFPWFQTDEGQLNTAAIAERRDGWVRVSLTTNVKSESAYAVIQMTYSGGQVEFESRGEQLEFKGLRLDQGTEPARLLIR